MRGQVLSFRAETRGAGSGGDHQGTGPWAWRASRGGWWWDLGAWGFVAVWAGRGLYTRRERNAETHGPRDPDETGRRLCFRGWLWFICPCAAADRPRPDPILPSMGITLPTPRVATANEAAAADRAAQDPEYVKLMSLCTIGPSTASCMIAVWWLPWARRNWHGHGNGARGGFALVAVTRRCVLTCGSIATDSSRVDWLLLDPLVNTRRNQADA
jgi:hypothetical protein